MGVLSSTDFDRFFADISRDFSIHALKTLRLSWHSELQRPAPVQSLSKFTTAVRPASFFQALPKMFITPPPVVHIIGTREESRFVGIRPVVIAPVVAKPFFAKVAADGRDRIYEDYAPTKIDFAATAFLQAATPEQDNKTPARKTLSLKSAPKNIPQEKRAEKRGTLTLKAKPADLTQKLQDSFTGKKLSRASSNNDLASLFKAELTSLTQRAEPLTPPLTAPDVIVEKRKNNLASKSWAELSQEAEAKAKQQIKKPFDNVDLAAAFKTEMQRALTTARDETTPAASAVKPRKPSIAA